MREEGSRIEREEASTRLFESSREKKSSRERESRRERA